MEIYVTFSFISIFPFFLVYITIFHIFDFKRVTASNIATEDVTN